MSLGWQLLLRPSEAGREIGGRHRHPLNKRCEDHKGPHQKLSMAEHRASCQDWARQGLQSMAGFAFLFLTPQVQILPCKYWLEAG